MAGKQADFEVVRVRANDEQVDAILSQVTRERLSEIAERVIRDEIHRLLGEGPK